MNIPVYLSNNVLVAISIWLVFFILCGPEAKMSIKGLILYGFKKMQEDRIFLAGVAKV